MKLLWNGRLKLLWNECFLYETIVNVLWVCEKMLTHVGKNKKVSMLVIGTHLRI